MSGDEIGRERAERAARAASDLLALAFDSPAGADPLRAAVGEVEDACAVLLAVLRRLQSLHAAERLRDDELDVEDENVSPATPDDPLAAEDLWPGSGDAVTDTLEGARELFEALADQATVAELLNGLLTLDRTEALAIVLERSLWEMAERRWPREP